MIDTATGQVLVERDVAFKIDGGLTRTRFLASTSNLETKVLVANGEWKSYSFSCRLLNREWAVLLSFKGESLLNVALALGTGSGDWSNWSEEEERRILSEHDELLRMSL